jgi:Flp pilus assembly protein TadG
MSTHSDLSHRRRRINRAPKASSRTERARWSIGQSATELALVLPLLVLLLVAITDSGRLFYTYLEVVGAARAGAQEGAQTIVTAGCTPQMEAAATGGANLPGITATATAYCCCGSGTSCTNFGVTINDGNSSSYCGDSTTPDETSCGAKPPCTDWRKYVQVNTTATFTTLLNYPGIQSSYTFNGQTIMRAQ